MSNRKDPFVYWMIAVAALTLICRSTAEAQDDRALAAQNEERIRQTLSKPTAYEFIETPLVDAVNRLKEYHELEIKFDNKALADVGITTDRPVTKTIRGVTLRNGLRYLLHDLDLTYLIQDEVLLITTPDEANKMLVRKIYDVRDLKPEGGYDKLIDDITRHIKPTSWNKVGGCGSITPFSADGIDALIVTQTQEIHDDLENLLSELRRLRKVPKDK